MASTIPVVDPQLIGWNPQAMVDQLKLVADAAAADVEALQTSTASGDMKPSVKLATTSALGANTRTDNVLTANANGALGNVDSVATTAGIRMLVKDEATQANNGIYDVTSVGGAGAPWVLTRSADADASAEVTPGMLVPVEQGSINADKIFQLDVAGPITLNTTSLVFADFRGLAVTAPADVTKAAAAVGISLTVARSDHKHDVTTAVPTAIGLANAEGSASSLARSDHVHSNGNQTFDLTLVAGTATRSSGITVTANTRANIAMKTAGAGVSGTRYAVAYTVGGPGVGAVAVTAKDSAAGDNTVNTDVSVLEVTLVEATVVS